MLRACWACAVLVLRVRCLHSAISCQLKRPPSLVSCVDSAGFLLRLNRHLSRFCSGLTAPPRPSAARWQRWRRGRTQSSPPTWLLCQVRVLWCSLLGRLNDGRMQGQLLIGGTLPFV